MTATPTVTATPPQTNGHATSTYDGDSNMVKSVIGIVTTYYPRREFELRVEGTTETVVKYYFTTAGRTAMRVNGVLTWLMVDQVGSTSVTSDINGALGDVVKYSAYGEVRAGGTATDYLYTSQRNEVEIGLDYYVARFYDPVTAHFIQADTIVPEPGSSKAYDRYGYINNNPVRYNDPSGHYNACGSNEWECQFHWSYKISDDDEKYVYETKLTTKQMDLIYDVAEIVATTVYEPLDWMVTIDAFQNGQGTPWMLLGLLPIIPSSIGRHADDVSNIIRKPIIIGENMDRVKNYANKMGGLTISDFIPDAEWTLERNINWIRQMRNEGWQILDIGPDFNRRIQRFTDSIKPDSLPYNMERLVTKGYDNYKKLFQRMGKWIGSTIE